MGKRKREDEGERASASGVSHFNDPLSGSRLFKFCSYWFCFNSQHAANPRAEQLVLEPLLVALLPYLTLCSVPSVPFNWPMASFAAYCQRKRRKSCQSPCGASPAVAAPVARNETNK